MAEVPAVITWYGQPISELSRPALETAFAELGQMYRDALARDHLNWGNRFSVRPRYKDLLKEASVLWPKAGE